jgi:HSP20 family protein
MTKSNFMQDKNLIRDNKKNQTIFSDLLKPWDEWIDNGILFRTGHTPAVNIIEEKLRFIVTLAAPGLKKSDFKIVINGNNKLTISVQKQIVEGGKEVDYLRNEFDYSTFSRSLTLPEEIKKDAIEAKYEDGILEVVLPRAEESVTYPEQTVIIK